MSFPIEILQKNNIGEILTVIHEYNPKILLTIRTSYLYLPQFLRLSQDIFNKINKRKKSSINFNKAVRTFQKADPIHLKEYFEKMEYSLSQFKWLLLSYLVIENIGAPSDTLYKIMQQLSLFKSEGRKAIVLRHAVSDFMYLIPSRALCCFLRNSFKMDYLLESILKCSENTISELLNKLGIEDSINSLTLGNRKAYCLALLLSEGFTVKEIQSLSTQLGVRVEGNMKIEKIQNFIHHTNIGPNDIIENLCKDLLINKREYFNRAYNLNETLEGETLRQAIISTMNEWSIARQVEFTIDPQYGKFTHIAKDEHK